MGTQVTPIACIPGVGLSDLDKYLGKTVEDFCAFGYGKKKDKENHCAHFVSHALNIQVGKTCTDLLPYRAKSAPVNVPARWGVYENERAGLFKQDGKHRDPFRGGTTRVNEIYNAVADGAKGNWDDRPEPKADCLIYATVPQNISKDRQKMNTMANKHVGVFTKGGIYNYSNTFDSVVCDTIEEFKTKFRGNYGKDVLFLWSAIPHVNAACVHSGAP